MSARADATFIRTLDIGGDGPRLAVKDLIDIEGVPTTAGSWTVARIAKPAEHDAACMAGARAAAARIVGKTNLHELAYGSTGLNPFYGTPRNPLDATLVPGGSSSGSAVAVATGRADVAYGSDTGGSVRIPAACCGIVGLKTTHGRVSLEGVWPLSPSCDTIGPMARDVAGAVAGMQLLEPGFSPSTVLPRRIGRLRLRRIDAPSTTGESPTPSTGGRRAAAGSGPPGRQTEIPPADRLLDQAVDDALEASGIEVVDVELDVNEWSRAAAAMGTLLSVEAAESNLALRPWWDLLDPSVAVRLEEGLTLARDPEASGIAAMTRAWWEERLAQIFADAPMLALPTLPTFPPPIAEVGLRTRLTTYTSVFNFAGLPALALPVPSAHPSLPGSVQLVAPRAGEELLLAAGAAIEAALSEMPPAR